MTTHVRSSLGLCCSCKDDESTSPIPASPKQDSSHSSQFQPNCTDHPVIKFCFMNVGKALGAIAFFPSPNRRLSLRDTRATIKNSGLPFLFFIPLLGISQQQQHPQPIYCWNSPEANISLLICSYRVSRFHWMSVCAITQMLSAHA